MIASRIRHGVYFIVMIFSLNVQAQNFEALDIPFEVNGKALDNPLIGGLLAPQFASFNLDGLGAEDLIVFDRNGDAILPFINNSTPGNPSYDYAPEYTDDFPQLLNFIILEDFNNDGKKDIFSQSPRGSAIEVYRNVSEGGNIAFELMKFDLPNGDFLQFISGGDYTQLYVSIVDIPSIIDYDGDGDLDILTFEAGGSYMYLFKNMVKEQNLPDDTLAYRLTDLCWGKFFESGNSEEISLSSNVNNCASALHNDDDNPSNSGQRHAGSTVLTLDGDGDGDLDMLLGDLTNRGLVYLENNPVDGVDFMTNQNLNFPTLENEVDLNIFLSPFYIDVDNDGKRDLIVAPNNELGSDNVNHIWYYNNIGEDDAPVFELIQKDFFVNESLQMGTSSYPAFFDYNGDGLQDIMVGNNGIFSDGKLDVSIFLYLNVGTKSEPSYTLVTDDFLGMKGILGEFDGFLAPTAGDLDGDGDEDIIVSDNKGFLFYFENTAGIGNTFDYDNYVYQYKDIRAGLNSKPNIVDVDKDGLMDLLIGEKGENTNPITGKFGGINFLKNIGSIGDPQFNSSPTEGENTNTVGNVYTLWPNNVSPGSSPYLIETDNGSVMFVGSRGGFISVYDNIQDSLYGTFDTLYAKMPLPQLGRRTTPTLKDIDDDGFFEILVGNDNGGLKAFNTIFKVADSVGTNDPTELTLDIYPNPAEELINIILPPSTKFASYTVYSMTGKLVDAGSFTSNLNELSIGNYVTGVYSIRIEASNNMITKKFIKI